MIGKREDAIALQIVTRVILDSSRRVEPYSCFRVEKNLRVQWFLAIVLAPERDRSRHVSTSAVAATENCADAAVFAKVALESITNCVILIELGWVADFRRKFVFDGVDLTTTVFGKHAQAVFKLVD